MISISFVLSIAFVLCVAWRVIYELRKTFREFKEMRREHSSYFKAHQAVDLFAKTMEQKADEVHKLEQENARLKHRVGELEDQLSLFEGNQHPPGYREPPWEERH